MLHAPSPNFHAEHSGTRCGSLLSHMRRTILSLGLVLIALASGACQEEGTVSVRSLRFEGVTGCG